MASPNLVSLADVTKRYAEKVPLDGMSVGIDDGDRAGVIGLNGSGKSTLLRLVAGVEEPDGGRVVHAGHVRIAYLAQEPDLDLSAPAVVAAGGTREAEALLDRLGLPDLEQPVGELSGGQRKRVALARALAQDAEVLVLDEPTNHLDPDSIEWLEAHLAGRRGCVVFVTHDRYLLDRVATRVVEVEGGGLRTYHGSFSHYLEERARRAELAEAEERTRANLARRELAWLRRGAQARTTKAKYRVDRAEALVATVGRPLEERTLSIDLPARRLGSKVVHLTNAGKRFGERWVLQGIDHKIAPGARTGIVGPNGAGKTTLLSLIAGRMEPDAGSVRAGDTVHVGWYGQDSQALAPGTRVLDAVREVAQQASTVEGLVVSADQLLERFLFDRQAQRAYVEELSGGERRRLELLRVLADAPNLLLLDEPTNDLDLDTLAVLEEYLDSWSGALVVASHDRWFLDRVCEDLFSVESDGSVRHHPGGWTAFRDHRRVLDEEARTARRAATRASGGGAGAAEGPTGRRPGKLAFHEQRELRQVERDIPRLESRRTTLEAELQTTSGDYERTAALGEELTRVLAELAHAEERWLALEAIKEGTA